MNKLVWVAIALLPACDVVFRVDQIKLDAPGAVIDAAPDTDDGCVMVDVGKYGAAGAGLISVPVCSTVERVLDPQLTVPGECTEVIEMGSDSICLIEAKSITVSNDMVVRGVMPVVFAASDSIHLNSSVTYTLPDSQSLNSSCGSAGVSGAMGGGAGGSYGTTGGKGGSPGGGTAQPIRSGPLGLQGGCPGQDSPIAGGSATGGKGGSGGGVLYFAAATTIQIGPTVHISASGGGGNGGTNNLANFNGGGGGGAGGLIAFDTPNLEVASSAQVFANGGGGGGGGAAAVSGAGTSGTSSTAYNQGGTGGAAPVTTTAGGGGNGATGSSSGTVGGAGTSSNGGGGGGGGGLGVIAIYSQTANAILQASPVPLIAPP